MNKDLDWLVAVTILIVGTFVFVASMLGAKSYVYASLSAIIPSLVYLRYRDRRIVYPTSIMSNRVFLFTSLIFFTLVVISMIKSLYSFHASWLHFWILLPAAVLVLFQILPSQKNQKTANLIILTEIMVVAAVMRWILPLRYIGLLGDDPWFHAYTAQRVVEEGHGYPLLPGYEFPSLHILTVIVAIITSLNVEVSMVFWGRLFETLGVLLIFILGKYLLNVKAGLLSALLLSVNPSSVLWGQTITPMSAGLSLLILCMICITAGGTHPSSASTRKAYTLGMILIASATIVLHSLTGLAILVLSTFIYFGDFIYQRVSIHSHTQSHLVRDYRAVSIIFIFFTFILLMSYWIYVSIYFFKVAVVTPLSLIGVYHLEKYPASFYISPGIETITLSLLGQFLYFSFTVLGSLYFLSKKEIKKTKFIYLTILIGLFAITYSPYVGVIPEDVILSDRWNTVMMMFLTITTAAGLLFLNTIIRRKVWRISALSLTCLLILSFSISDSNVMRIRPPIYITNTEMTAAETIVKYAGKEATLATDYRYLNCYEYHLGLTTQAVDFSETVVSWVSGNDINVHSPYHLILVTEILTKQGYITLSLKRATMGYVTYHVEVDMTRLKELMNSPSFNRVFDNMAVTGYA